MRSHGIAFLLLVETGKCVDVRRSAFREATARTVWLITLESCSHKHIRHYVNTHHRGISEEDCLGQVEIMDSDCCQLHFYVSFFSFYESE